MSIDMTRYAAFDLETGGIKDEYMLQPFRQLTGRAWINTSAIAWREAGSAKTHTKGYVRPDIDEHREMLQWAIDNDITLVGWNVPFDVAWLISQGLLDVVRKVKWIDVMRLLQHLTRQPEYDLTQNKRRSYSLKAAVAEEYPQYAGYEQGVEYNIQHDDVEAMQKLLKYNRLDSALTLALFRKYYLALLAQSKQQLRNALIESSAIVPVAEAIVYGMTVDMQAAEELKVSLQTEIERLGDLLAEHGITKTVLNSPLKLRKLLYEEWNLPVVHKTPKGEPSTDKVALYLLAPRHTMVDKIKKFREHNLNYTKFCDKVQDSYHYNGDNQTRPAPRIYGTYTGRMTFESKQGKGKDERQTGFAIHQMKNDPEFRKLICAPPGYTLIEWDAASQEYRWMAIESNDSTMLSLCQPGEDPHSYMGASIIHEEYEWMQANKDDDMIAKQGRKMGKVGNLSCQFRIGWRKLHTQAHVQFGLPISTNEAQLIHQTYHATYPGVRNYWNRKIAEARRKGYAETLAGRRVQLDGNWADPDLNWKMESTAVNFPIQGVGADQKYLAMRVMQNYLPQCGGRFYFELHDGLYAIIPDDKAMKWGLKIREALSNLPYKKAWGVELPVPLPFDMKIGKSWGEMEEIK